MAATKRITKWQFILTTIVVLMGISLRTSATDEVAGRDAWVAPIIGLLMSVPTLTVYCLLMRRYPGKDIFEINELVFGKVFGKLLSVFYLLFFLNIASLNTLEMSDFTANYILPDSPILICALAFCLTSAYAVHKGIITIARIAPAIVVVSAIMIIWNWIESIPQMQFQFIQPSFAQPITVYLQSGHINSTMVFGELLVVLTFCHRLDTRKTSLAKCLTIASLLAMVFFSMSCLREVLMLGNLAAYLKLPTFEAVRMTGVSMNLSRTESIYSLMMIVFSLCGELIYMWAALQGLKQVFALKDNHSMILPLAVLIAMYGTKVLHSPEDVHFRITREGPFLWPFFITFLPLLALLVSLIRRQKLDDPRLNEPLVMDDNGNIVPQSEVDNNYSCPEDTEDDEIAAAAGEER